MFLQKLIINTEFLFTDDSDIPSRIPLQTDEVHSSPNVPTRWTIEISIH